MKKNVIEVEPINGKYALYINGNYMGIYCKAILNIKLRAWNLPEIEL